ncbi:subtilisin-like protease SBT3.9 [Cynara cardunculus var. scolymus]|uniref:subtilisin-like protease SBT3.9 n=1 Tax=Cynara cardunculus var. scolymus TaxID=59895 RepID=UPI000D628F55|nr:subtilisin-like protease SBT3.9 [Cynara cardunculus var. scolymus]
MGSSNNNVFIGLFICVSLAHITIFTSAKVYVVYMGGNDSDDPDEILMKNHQMLASVHSGSVEEAHASHLYTYKHGFRGFAAKLTDDQALQIAEMPGVVSVFENKIRRLHTTHSWDFIGLAGEETMEIPGFSTKDQVNVIIGFIDTGIWPESASFSDTDMPPVPAGWRGKCQSGEAFNITHCNRKLIGARYYLSGYEAEKQEKLENGEVEYNDDPKNKRSFQSPRDSNGHGTHTASTAAGRYVMDMNYKGLARGGARGGAPMARVAVYKTCWDSGCYDADILAAFDDAVRDGVHIVSLSLGPDAPQGDYFSDAISIGSFHAVSRGITVVSSVGNEGTKGAATNLAPWMITVAATSIDREFTANVVLGNGVELKGESLSVLQMRSSARIISASIANGGYFTPYQSSYCLESSLNYTKTRGKVLLCRHAERSSESKVTKSEIVKAAGGVGMILVDENVDVAIPFAIPAAIVGRKVGNRILSYINNTRRPTSQIFSSEAVLGSQPAPRVSSFSSKGPNGLTPEILKPDVAAPGLNILAAWSPAIGQMKYNILSGTSMACPHVTGIVALIKAVHPSWSPSAVKSAIMTTASIFDKSGKPMRVDPEGRRGNAFDYGSGFVDPTTVLDPGLVYDATAIDYKAFLCSIGYDEKSLRLITRDQTTCENQPFTTPSSLNYPSIVVPNLKTRFSVTRTLTFVGNPEQRTVYEAVVAQPRGVEVDISPRRLVFDRYGQTMNFTASFKPTAPSLGYVFGYLQWKNGKSRVTTPLVVRIDPSDLGSGM